MSSLPPSRSPSLPVDPRGVVGLGMAQLRAEAVAEQSGGEAFYNNNDLKSLIAKAINHGSQFYTLSYIPPKQKDDGHYHHIKIELVDQPKLHLVYREGYNAERVPTLDAPAPGPALMKASMEGNTPAATQILFDVGVWPGSLANPAANPQPQGRPQIEARQDRPLRDSLRLPAQRDRLHRRRQWRCSTARSSSMPSPTTSYAGASHCLRRPSR